jgi:hypothetical protein
MGTGGGRPHGIDNLLRIRKAIPLLVRHFVAVDEHGELTARSVHEVDLGIGLFPQ